MARYWVLGTGNWSDTAHWSASSGGAGGETVPSSSDNVIFDSLSNDVAYTVTVDATANCLDFTMGAPLAGAVTWAGASALNIYGSMNLSGGTAGITRTYTGAITFGATATGKTITCNAVTLTSATTFNGVGGGWTLQDAFNIGTAKTLTLTNGALDTNGVTITASVFSSSNSNIRTLTLGASTLNFSSNSPWSFSTTTNLTFNANTSTVNFTGTSANVDGGGLTYNNVIFTAATGPSLAGTNTFANLTITGSAVNTARISLYADQIVTGTLTINGNSLINRLIVKSDTMGTVRTLTAAVVSIANADFRDITGAGGAAPFTGTSISAALGGCSGITQTTPVTRYWVGGTGSWSSTGEWSASSGGASGASVPLVQDTAVFDANSFSGGGLTCTVDVVRVPTIDFTNATNSPNLTISPSTELYGSLDLTGVNTFSCTSIFYLYGRSANTIKSNGKLFGGNIVIDCVGGSYTLSDNLSSDGADAADTIQLLSGTFDANDFNVTYAKLDLDGGITRVCTMGNGIWTLTGTSVVFDADPSTNLTLNAEGSTIVVNETSATSKVISGGGLIYNNITVSGDNVILSGSNTINILAVNTAGLATGLKIASASTQIVSGFTTNGSVGNLAIIQSSSAGSAHNLSKATGTISVDYMSIKDSAAAGGADWYAGANSTDVSGNSGWIFTGPPSGDSSMQQYQYYYS